jgi:hypothetical protein
MRRAVKILLPSLLLGFVLPALAGEKLDALRDAVQTQLTSLEERTLTEIKAEKKADAAAEELAEALDLLDIGDEMSVKSAFKRIGKGMCLLEKAAKKEDDDEFTAFVDAAVGDLWTRSVLVLNPGDTSEPPTDEEAVLLAKLGKKMRSSVKLSTKGKFGKAVQKLKKAYPTLLLLESDP